MKKQKTIKVKCLKLLKKNEESVILGAEGIGRAEQERNISYTVITESELPKYAQLLQEQGLTTRKIKELVDLELYEMLGIKIKSRR